MNKIKTGNIIKLQPKTKRFQNQKDKLQWKMYQIYGGKISNFFICFSKIYLNY